MDTKILWPIANHMVSQNVSYNDLGDLYLDKLNKNHLTRNLVHRLERLGYSVTLAPAKNGIGQIDFHNSHCSRNLSFINRCNRGL